MCSVLDVTRSGYYAWKNRQQSQRDKENLYLLEQIQEVYEKSRKNYGAPRIYFALLRKGVCCGRNRVARIMRDNGIIAKTYKRFKRGKGSVVQEVVADNIVNQKFEVDNPNKIWAADITYFGTRTGWLYLAVVMDLYSRKVIGWSMNTVMTDDLTKNALKMAILRRNPKKGVIHHSDRGGQYVSSTFREELEKNHILHSLSRKGNCYDNAVIESFFKTLKTELEYGRQYKTKEEARKRLFEYIEVYYNKQRLHSTLGYLSPQEFEEQHTPNLSVL